MGGQEEEQPEQMRVARVIWAEKRELGWQWERNGGRGNLFGSSLDLPERYLSIEVAEGMYSPRG